ncbi:50S ribosomal protein L6 [Candidatus Falkowbacteria bacterium]|jgi:large subunit ribosomal protein L6|nr:50S ribosomal protein L6 [Candidatus Falkowbacteria bacterium]MBT5503002.1 50S ribosomal protein L6 [Candidatus Falkowbacteria bacterium]MBT6574358.1 50S ribosomal protein L6 [Candidatus Falkowbacteria bacterium]MBT7349049.1 50S ribosomal protein L6 [Candidatus Falkowbacteria bacterium]MBT7500957.1 50S ribosomal protein L6 [Candidatus Falkowbacteria bacterium]
MSRIGKKPIEIPSGVNVTLDQGLILVKGPKGELQRSIHPLVKVEIKDTEINVKVDNEENHIQKALWGLFRSLIYNMVVGVTEGFEKKLEINGVGYKANATGQNLVLNVGYSHAVEFNIPEGINCQVEANVITISGIDKQQVGEVAANIRKVRKPEPYKGKGIKYIDEIIRRKAGKAAAKAAA